jgi:hypothetical protein
MKRIVKSAIWGGLAAVLLTGANPIYAQQERPNRGNFDPEQARQRMMERYKEQLDVKDEAEWKVIQERIEKVTAARREVGGGAFGMGFGGRRGGGGAGGGGGGGGFRGGGEPLPEAEALQKAIEAKASSDEIKQKLAKLREARKEKEAKLEKAQDELRKVLSARQEASAVLMGLLK